MTVTQLLDLIRNGENSGVEFKRDTIDSRELAIELVAFANLRGGVVLLGVEDNGSIVGITRPNLEEWVMTSARDKIRPELIPYYELLRDVEPGRHVAAVSVEMGWTAHALWHNQHRYYYIRVGSQARDANQDELARLLQQRGSFRLELRPVSGASFDDLDGRRLVDYFRRIRQQETPVDDDREAWIRLLVNTELLADQPMAPATVAGLLLFGRNVNRYLPQAGIAAAAYVGADKDYGARERGVIRGPMTALFSAMGEVIETGLVEQAVEFVRRNTRIHGTLEDGARRVERRDYPDDAVRETIVNALVHRDYMLSGTDIELSLYMDRLEVVSPGRLPNDVTPERMRVGTRAARNQLLKDAMRDYGYMEHMGMGVPRKIIRSMQDHNGTQPDLIAEDERFTVRLWR